MAFLPSQATGMWLLPPLESPPLRPPPAPLPAPFSLCVSSLQEQEKDGQEGALRGGSLAALALKSIPSGENTAA